jgi:hypothetical protein
MYYHNTPTKCITFYLAVIYCLCFKLEVYTLTARRLAQFLVFHTT